LNEHNINILNLISELLISDNNLKLFDKNYIWIKYLNNTNIK
jgi:hypothetical protein